VVGNKGTDRFFSAAEKPLPAGCDIAGVEFHQFWPNQRGSDSPWHFLNDAGSYDAVYQHPPDFGVGWHNACAGAFNGKNLYYVISFLVSMPASVNLGEDTFDPGVSLIQNQTFSLPAGYQWNPPSAGPPPPPPSVSLTGEYRFEVPQSSQPSSVTVVFTGSLNSASTGAAGTRFNVSVNAQVPIGPAKVRVPFSVSGLRPGLWTVTAAPNGIGAPARCPSVSLPGTVVLTVINGEKSCVPQL
jgi:hypothetical protein